MKFVKLILVIIAFIAVVGFLILSFIKTPTPEKETPVKEEEEKPKIPVEEKFNASASAVSDAVVVEENQLQ